MIRPAIVIGPDGSARVRRGPRRAGAGAVEVVVVAAILAFGALMVLILLPRGRERARRSGCQRNLMQIGVGLGMYQQANRAFPMVGTVAGAPAGASPIAAMLDALVLPDFLGLDPTRPTPQPLMTPARTARVPGLTCPSDSIAAGNQPVSSWCSYRATTGDRVDGTGGPFGLGRSRPTTVVEVEAADGLAYTAGFAERLVGTGADRQPGPRNYASGPGPVTAEGCPDLPNDRWRGDAGTSWDVADWRSTLYTHSLIPGDGRSCLADDQRSARIGSSSVHPEGVHVLMLDGSLRTVAPTIQPRVWQALGTIGSPAAESPP